MRINDITQLTEDDPTVQDEELAAVAQLLVDKADNVNAPAKLNVDAFIAIANKMGLSLTPELLKTMATSGDLQNIITNINDTEVVFKGKADVDIGADMTVDRARDVVNDMAKKNMRKKGLGSEEPDERDAMGI